jgi:hypothetical protein
VGGTVKKLGIIAVAVFAPYAAAALGLSGFAATAFSFVLQAAVSTVLSPKPSGGGGGNVTDSGFLINKTSNNAAIPIVYGDRRVGGTRVYVNTTNEAGVRSDDNNQFLHIIMAVAQGATGTDSNTIKDFVKVQFNNKEIWSGSSAGNSGSLTSGSGQEFNENVTLRMWHGAHNQTSNSPNYSIGPSGGLYGVSSDWTSGTHDMKGIAYIYVICKYNRDLFPGAPTITVDIKGKKVKALTSTTAHPTSYVDTDADRTNPANIIYDYLTDATYGKGISTGDIDIESFKLARDYANGGAAIDFNGAIATEDTIFNNTQKLLSCANMNLVYVNGMYHLQPVKQETFNSSTFKFTTANIIDKVTIALGNKKTRFNRMKVNFFNPSLDWQPDSVVIKDLTEVIADGTTVTMEAADSGVINEKTIDLPFIADSTLATKLGTYYLKISRKQRILSFKASHEALKLQVGDPVKVNHDVYGFSDTAGNNKYRVNSITLNPNSTVDVILEEYAPDSVYLENN